MNENLYLILKQAGFETGFQNTFIENNSAKFDKFVALLRKDERDACAEICKALASRMQHHGNDVYETAMKCYRYVSLRCPQKDR